MSPDMQAEHDAIKAPEETSEHENAESPELETAEHQDIVDYCNSLDEDQKEFLKKYINKQDEGSKQNAAQNMDIGTYEQEMD